MFINTASAIQSSEQAVKTCANPDSGGVFWDPFSPQLDELTVRNGRNATGNRGKRYHARPNSRSVHRGMSRQRGWPRCLTSWSRQFAGAAQQHV